VVRTPANDADYVALFHTVQRNGVVERFGKRRYRYWYAGDGFKYWTMTTDVNQSRVINRAKVDGGEAGDAPLSEMNLNADAVEACGVGWRRADDDWSFSTAAERAEAWVAASALAWPKRRERKPSLAAALRVVKTAQKAGLPVRRAVIGGVAVEFGQPESGPAGKAPDYEVEAWIRKQQESHAH
jgi:hypothetical protein